jgi:hypothetical protein
MPILAPLQLDLLIKQPPNIREHCIEWLKKYSTPLSMQITQITTIPKSSSATRSPKRCSSSAEGKEPTESDE